MYDGKDGKRNGVSAARDGAVEGSRCVGKRSAIEQFGGERKCVRSPEERGHERWRYLFWAARWRRLGYFIADTLAT